MAGRNARKKSAGTALTPTLLESPSDREEMAMNNQHRGPARAEGDTLTRMIHGAHVIIYSTDPEADRAFFRDVLKYESVDAGHGWLIFALPPAEVAVHPSDKNDVHELFLMCDDVQALIAEMKKKKVGCSPVDEQRWGSITRLTLPGGGKLGIYQPKHPSPLKVRAT